MKKHLHLLLPVVLVIMLLPVTASARKTNDVFVTPLYAGQHIDVGMVSVWNDAGFLYVQYDTTGGWGMTETHVYVDIVPPETGAPGQFPYMHEDLGGATTDLYAIALDNWGPGTLLYIAAHTEVCT
jgi:hypothetical protein